MAKHFVCSLRNFNQKSNKSAAFIVKKTLHYPQFSFYLALSEKKHVFLSNRDTTIY